MKQKEKELAEKQKRAAAIKKIIELFPEYWEANISEIKKLIGTKASIMKLLKMQKLISCKIGSL